MAAKKRPTEQKADYVKIGELFNELLHEVKKTAESKDNDSILDALREAKRDIFETEDKRVLRKLQSRIAAKLRGVPVEARPSFDSQIGFFLWVIHNVPESEEPLKLLDSLGECPDEFRIQLEKHYDDAKFNYNTL